MNRTSLFHIHRDRTPAGLRLLVVPMAGTSTVALMIAVGTGSRYEAASQAGISHFLEHLFFKGSKKRPSHRAISETLDGIGGAFNAFTSKEMTAFWAKAGAQHAELLLDVFSDMLIHPLFNPQEIDRERGVITEEINMYEDTPPEFIEEFSEELLYGMHPLGRQIIGRKEVITRLPRTAFLRYVGRQYSVRNTVACFAGNISSEKGVALLSRMLKAFPAPRPRHPSPFRRTWGRGRVAVKEKQTDQAHIMVVSPGVSATHRDRTTVDLLCALLGGGMSSRLFSEVRERRGLAYAIRTSPQHFTDVGHIATQAGVDPAKLPEAIRVILDEYRKIRTKPVPAAELRRAKESVKGRLLLRLESADEVAQFAAGQEVLTNRILTIEEIFARIDAVTSPDIRRAARATLKPAALRLAAITHQHEAASLERILRRAV